jgi:hypothetical protein
MAVNGAAFPLNPVPRRTTTKAGGSPGVTQAGSAPPVAKAKDKGAATGGSRASASGTTTTAPAPAQAPPLAPASSGADEGGGIPGWLIVAVAVALAAGGIWGGWVLYSRRLPG